MKKLLGLLLMASLFVFTGCKDDEVIIPQEPDVPEVPEVPDDGKVTLTIAVPDLANAGTKSRTGEESKADSLTRVSYNDETLGFTWDADDQIVVLSYKGSDFLGAQTLTLASGEKTATGTFEAVKAKDATRYVIYYKAAKLTISEKGISTMNYDGQQQDAPASTAHLRDYLYLQSGEITADAFNAGKVELKLTNSIMRFSVKSMKPDVGQLESIEWVNAYRTKEAHSIILKLGKGAVTENTITAFFCFNPDSMQVARGATTGLIFRGTNLYHVMEADADGRTFGTGGRYETVVTTDTSDDALHTWERIQMDNEIWVKADGKPNFVPVGFKVPEPVLGTDYWCYKQGEGKNVTEIGKDAFKGASELTSIRLPKTITSIGDGAFAGCSSLKELYIVTNGDCTIGKNLFEGVPTTEVTVTLSENFASQVSGLHWQGKLWKKIIIINANGEAVDNKPAKNQIWVRTEGDVVPPTIQGFTTPEEKDPHSNYWKYMAAEDFTVVPDNLFGAAQNRTVITEVFLPEGITAIGASAFEGCTNLKEVQLQTPATLVKIGSKAFKDCGSMTSLTYPEALKELGAAAFMGCSKLEKITLPKAVTTLAASTFENCIGLTELILPEGFTSFGDKALKGCNKLGSFTIPASVTNIGAEAFACKLDKFIVKAGPAMKVSTDAFGAEKNLPTELSLLEDWFSAPAVAPVDNVWMTYTWKSITFINADGSEVQIQQGKDEIWFTTKDNIRPDQAPVGFTLSAGMMQGKYWSFKATDGKAVTTLPASVFAGQPVTSVSLPSELTTVSDGAFKGCTGLKEFMGKFATADGRALVQGNTLLSFAPAGLKAYTLPAGVTQIAPYACYGSALETITLPGKLESVGVQAFGHSPQLMKFVSDQATEYGRYLIIGETLVAIAPANLTSFVTPVDVTAVADQVAAGCDQLTDVTITSQITKIGSQVFAGCSNLEKVTVEAAYGISLGDKLFGTAANIDAKLYLDYTWQNVPSDQPIGNEWLGYTWKSIEFINEPVFTEPAENEIWVKMKDNKTPAKLSISKDAVKVYGKDYWRLQATDEKKIEAIPANLFARGTYADYANITEIWLPSGVKTIGERAFYECTALTKVTLPEGLEQIDTEAFRECRAMTSIAIPASLKTIGEGVFVSCDKLSEFTGTHAKAGGKYLTLTKKNGLTAVPTLVGFAPFGHTVVNDIPAEVKVIDNSVFEHSGVTTVELHRNITHIGDGAFEFCADLASVDMKGVSEIGVGAFQGSTKLRNVTFDPAITKLTIHNIAFFNSGEPKMYLETLKLPQNTTLGGSVFLNTKIDDLTIQTGIKVESSILTTRHPLVGAQIGKLRIMETASSKLTTKAVEELTSRYTNSTTTDLFLEVSWIKAKGIYYPDIKTNKWMDKEWKSITIVYADGTRVPDDQLNDFIDGGSGF